MIARLMLALVAAFALLAAPGTAAAKQEKDYAGADGGYLVYAVGTIRIGMHFDFPYRRLSTLDGGAAEKFDGKIKPFIGGAFYLKNKDPDFEGFENGRVVVRRVPPGRYAITDFQFAGSSPTGSSYQWNSGTPFSIEFTVEPGKATYIGSFMRSPTPNNELLPRLGYAGYFLIANRAERDLPFARARLPEGTEIGVQFTNVETFGSAALRSTSYE